MTVIQTPNRLDRADGRERDILIAALARPCSLCGAEPSRWCFRVGGEWTVHGQRIFG